MATQFIGAFSIGTTLDRGLRLYKSVLTRVFPFMFIPLMITYIPYIHDQSALHKTSFNRLEAVFLIINIFAGIWAFNITLRYMQKVCLGESPTISEMIGFGRPKDFALIITYLIWGMIMMFSIILLILPIFFISNFIMTGLIVAVIERKFFFSGVSRTFSLIKRRWWKTFAINLISVIIVFVPIVISFTVYGLLLASASTTPESQAFSPSVFLGLVFYGLVVALSFPAITSITLVHYNSLRCEKENMDLENTIDKMGKSCGSNLSAVQ